MNEKEFIKWLDENAPLTMIERFMMKLVHQYGLDLI